MSSPARGFLEGGRTIDRSGRSTSFHSGSSLTWLDGSQYF